MFERFTDRARRVTVLAQEEARLFSHNYIGTEHILLALIHEGEGVAAKTLTTMGISLDAVRGQVGEIIGRGQQMPSGHIPFTPRTKKVLELALREALGLGHNYIGTEHILLGLIREGEGVGAQVLVKLGVELTQARKAVFAYLGYGSVPPPARREYDDDQLQTPDIISRIAHEIEATYRSEVNPEVVAIGAVMVALTKVLVNHLAPISAELLIELMDWHENTN